MQSQFPFDPRRRVGLYDPAIEHDACGVGFVVNMHGEKSHQIVALGSGDPRQPHAPRRLRLRSADRRRRRHSDANARTSFSPPRPAKLGISTAGAGRLRHRARLPAAATKPSGAIANERLEAIVADEGRCSSAGATCRSTTASWAARPATSSRSSARCSSPAARKRRPTCSSGSCTSFASGTKSKFGPRASSTQKAVLLRSARLSSRVIIYKGLLLADQVERFYHDLADERIRLGAGAGASALQHQHVSDLGPGPSVPLPGPQRRNQHAARQRQLDARPRKHVRQREVRRRFEEDLPGLHPRSQRFGRCSTTRWSCWCSPAARCRRPCRCSFPSRGVGTRACPTN